MMRASLLEVLGEDYIRMRPGRDVGRQVVLRHAPLNAWLPVITVLPATGALLAGG
jgi:ABC-type dipeptide/oligopeptide/nickel transport system permease component